METSMSPEEIEKNILVEAEHSSGDKQIHIMPDGNKITIGLNAVDIFEKLQRLPISYKLTLLNVTEKEAAEYYENIYDINVQDLLNILDSKWIWHETGEPMIFNDEEENAAVLGIGLTKKQIKGRLKRKFLSTQKIIEILEFFDNQREVIEP